LTNVTNSNKCAESIQEVFIANFDKNYDARMKILRIKNFADQYAQWEKKESTEMIFQYNNAGYWLISCNATNSFRLKNCIQIPSDAEPYNVYYPEYSGLINSELVNSTIGTYGSRLYGSTYYDVWADCGSWTAGWYYYANKIPADFTYQLKVDAFIGGNKNIVFTLDPDPRFSPPKGEWKISKIEFKYYW
jgi:hypothetical protein